MIDHLVSGAINWDISIFVDRLPEQGQEIKIKKILEVPGGKGANIAVASSRILGKNRVAIFGGLGSDSLARKQLQDLHNEGIATDIVQQIKGIPSGQAYIIVDMNGKNSIMTFKHANDCLTSKMVNDNKTIKALAKSSVITVVDPPLSVAKEILIKAWQMDKITIWTPGLLTTAGAEAIKLLKYVNFLILNESEAYQLTGSDNPIKSCRILNPHIKSVIITLGSSGCIYTDNKKIIKIPTVKLKSIGKDAVNSVGAGDAFTGTFSAMKILRKDNIESIILANIAGALKTTKNETRGSPSFEEIIQISKKISIRTRQIE